MRNRKARNAKAGVSVIIVGGGFSGLTAAVDLLSRGIPFTIFESSPSVGGTWWHNRYPGCACDIPSILYALSFTEQPNWSSFFPSQPEILEYVRAIVVRYNLLRHIQLNTTIDEVRWDEATGMWHVTTTSGVKHTARFVYLCSGSLTIPSVPQLPGAGLTNEGPLPQLHSAGWPSGDPLAPVIGRRVAIVGTGASAIQILPEVAAVARHVTLYQRTPAWIVPRFDYPLRWFHWAALRVFPGALALMRCWMFLYRELLHGSVASETSMLRKLTNGLIRKHMRDSLKARPELLKVVQPSYPIGCKRLLLSNMYLPALCRENVTILPHGVQSIDTRGGAVVGSDGQKRSCDVVVWATGFDILAPRMRVIGRGNASLFECPPRSYYGVMRPEFPNLVMSLGPGSGLGHNTVVFMIECQIALFGSLIDTAVSRGANIITVTRRALDEHIAFIRREMVGRTWTAACGSWYQLAKSHPATAEADHGEVIALWPLSCIRYWWDTRRPRLADFELSRARA